MQRHEEPRLWIYQYVRLLCRSAHILVDKWASRSIRWLRRDWKVEAASKQFHNEWPFDDIARVLTFDRRYWGVRHRPKLLHPTCGWCVVGSYQGIRSRYILTIRANDDRIRMSTDRSEGSRPFEITVPATSPRYSCWIGSQVFETRTQIRGLHRHTYAGQRVPPRVYQIVSTDLTSLKIEDDGLWWWSSIES